MHEQRISRAQFLAGAAGVVGLTSLPGRALADVLANDAQRPLGLTYRGVGYQVQDGETPYTGWDAARMRADLRVIADDLHANSVSVFGDGVERLTATAAEAVRRERVEHLLSGRFDAARMQRRLDRFIPRAAAAGRSAFGGTLSYGAAQDDKVDWSLFDVVSANAYTLRFRSATVYNFIEPDAPHRRDPRYDLDLASHRIVKPIWKRREQPTAGWHWEPKEAFDAVARHFGRAVDSRALRLS